MPDVQRPGARTQGGYDGDNMTHDTAAKQPYERPKGQLDSGWLESKDKEDPTSYMGGSSPDSVKEPQVQKAALPDDDEPESPGRVWAGKFR